MDIAGMPCCGPVNLLSSKSQFATSSCQRCVRWQIKSDKWNDYKVNSKHVTHKPPVRNFCAPTFFHQSRKKGQWQATFHRRKARKEYDRRGMAKTITTPSQHWHKREAERTENATAMPAKWQWQHFRFRFRRCGRLSRTVGKTLSKLKRKLESKCDGRMAQHNKAC